MNKQLDSQCVIKYMFTHEQIEEQEQFTQDLKAGNASIAFEGSFLEGMAFLKGTNELVENIVH